MNMIGKILVLSLAISALIKYGLPLWLDLEQLSSLQRQAVAIVCLTVVPVVFLGYLGRK